EHSSSAVRSRGSMARRSRWREVHQEIDEQARAEAGGSLRAKGLVAIAFHRGARDVEVGPGQVRDELFQKERGGDGARVVAADVLQVGDGRVELFSIAPLEREL